MGLDLTLLPMVDSDEYSHEVIKVRDWDLMDAILKLPELDISDGFTSYLSINSDYEEYHYGETIETPYDERLTYTQAKYLKTVGLTGPTGAYVNALDDLVKVALFWH